MSWFSDPAKGNDLKNKFELVLKSSSELVIILDSSNKVIEVNDRIKEIFNIERREILGQKIQELVFLDKDSTKNSEFLNSLPENGSGYPIELDCLDRYKNKIILAANVNGIDGIKVIVFKEISSANQQINEESGLKFLSVASLKLLELLPEKDIYQYVANQLAFLVHDSYIFINKQLSPTKIVTVASATSSKTLKNGFKVIGGDPTGSTFDINEKAEFTLTRGKVSRLEGGVHELSFGRIPKTVALLAEKTVGIKSVFSVGFFWKGKLFGSAAIITRSEATQIENAGIIETFVNLASVALQRRKAEDELQLTIEALDIEKRRATQEKDKLDTILHSIGDGVIVVNGDKKIILANETAINIVGSDSLFSKQFSEALKFIDEKDGKLSDFVGECIRTGEVKRIVNKAILVLKNEKLPVDLTVSPLRDGDKIIGSVVVFGDATQTREIDQAKSEFVSLASHQLRSPLASINWSTELLLAKKADPLTKKQKEWVSEIYSSSKRMSELVKSLLNVSRIELGTFVVNPKSVAVGDIVESVLKEVEPRVASKHQKIIKNVENIKLNADSQLLRIIIQNFLTNAVKYTGENGEIKVGVGKKADKIIIEVTDNGYGIPKKQQEQIFTKLFRADNVKLKETDGNGLGLYIIKEIVDNSGGKVWFTSEENKGTSFYVEYPLAGMIKKAGTKELN